MNRIDLEELNMEHNIIDISKNTICRNKWFIGSALFSQDLASIESGCFYYEQNTIWTKRLNVENINPYWEIYNRTINYLLVNQNSNICITIFQNFLKKLSSHYGLSLCSFFIITSNDSFELFNNFDNIIIQNIDFLIDGKQVGNYIKIFYNYEGRFIPVVDCTIFSLHNKSFFEININKFYLEMLNYFKKNDIPPKFQNINLNWTITEIFQNQEKIKFISLEDCIKYLSENNIKCNSKFNGHSVKKILKEYYFYGAVNNVVLSTRVKNFSKEYIKFIETEKKKYDTKYIELINKYPCDILEDRYGVSKKTQAFLRGDNNGKKEYYVGLTKINYYTDIPFINQKINKDQFAILINTIKKRKG